tara:strand:- start:1645 stop:2040 length:396 start_codon:yes stop_codon:yes gene_type:complete
MAFTLLSRILPYEIAKIIFDYIKLNKTQQIYWEQLYSPTSFIIKDLIKIYSDYNKAFNPLCHNIDRISIIAKITNKLASRGVLQKNIYIYMDEYIDNLDTLKKHLQFHLKDMKQLILLNQPMVDYLTRFAF